MTSAYCFNAGRIIASSLAQRLNVQEPTLASLVFAVQVQRETADGNATLSPGVRGNNPLNLTAPGSLRWPGQTGFYSGGDTSEWHSNFATFDSLESGCKAAAQNYAGTLYLDVQNAFRLGDPVALAAAIQGSLWDTGHYGWTLVSEVRARLVQKDDLVGERKTMTPEELNDLFSKTDVGKYIADYLAKIDHHNHIVEGAKILLLTDPIYAPVTGAELVSASDDGSVVYWKYPDGTTHTWRVHERTEAE